MKLFDVYPLQNIVPISAQGSYLKDDKGETYLDLYGGHAVISIGHSHPYYINKLQEQLNNIGFYSNSVVIPQQQQLADLLGKVSGCDDYQLFLVNSGAEANENALKIASFVTKRKKIIAFKGAFHGRTSGAVAATDNPKIVAPFNANHEVVFVPFDDIEAVKSAMDNEVAAVIIECIQGVGGIQVANETFLKELSAVCKANGTLLIADEVQCGYGRTGKFFAFQYAGITPDLITMAKGMGNGFPVGGVLVGSNIEAWHGMLGTTFGGNYLACAAAIAVLEIMEQENLLPNAATIGALLMEELKAIPQLENVRGKGLMIGFDVPEAYKNLRTRLLQEHKIFTGNAGTHTVRLLPALNITTKEVNTLIAAIKTILS
jgi:acetylornithine/N-succinyldiaminopimelate aminotransferase